MRVRFGTVLDLLFEYGEHESSSVAHMPNVIRNFFYEEPERGCHRHEPHGRISVPCGERLDKVCLILHRILET